MKRHCRGLPNWILTPIGGSTHEAQASIGPDVRRQTGTVPRNRYQRRLVERSTLTLPVQQDTHRILHIHATGPVSSAKSTFKLTKLNVNILGQYLQTNDRIGYVVTDMDKRTSSKALC